MRSIKLRHASPTPPSLRARITRAVMVPLAILISLLVSITAWAVHATDADTVDRVLVGSVRTLSLAYNSPRAQRENLMPLAVHLLERRARPVVHYSVFEGDRFVSGQPSLTLPTDIAAYRNGAVDLHPPANFRRNIRSTPMTRGYILPADARTVVQAAYLRYGRIDNRPARIATEIRRLDGGEQLVTIQIADFLDDRRAYELAYFGKLAAGGIGVLLIAAVFMWWAVTWGLRPFFALTAQTAAAQSTPSPSFRLQAQADTPAEILPFVGAFNGLMARLEKTGEALRQFTSNASHQMRTPLTIARLHLDVLSAPGASAETARAAISDIGKAVESLERLLLQLIALARAEEQKIDSATPFSLSQVVTRVTSEHARMVHADRVDIHLEDHKPGLASGNIALTTELVSNLIDNAIRHNQNGGNVWVTITSNAEGHPQLAITDDGPGIPDKERERVWERFYRGQKGSDAVGSGLGLPIVRALADQMGARVALGSGHNGQGLRVTVDFLPAPLP